MQKQIQAEDVQKDQMSSEAVHMNLSQEISWTNASIFSYLNDQKHNKPNQSIRHIHSSHVRSQRQLCTNDLLKWLCLNEPWTQNHAV